MNDLNDDAFKLKEFEDWLVSDFKVGFENKLAEKFESYITRLRSQQSFSDRVKEQISELYNMMDDIRNDIK